MDFNKYSHEKKIVKLKPSDKDFLKNKIIDSLNLSTSAFPVYIFLGTLVGIYHLELWRGFFMILLLYFLFEGKDLLKTIPFILGLLSGKKIVGVAKMVDKINYNEQYFGRYVKIDLIKSRTIYLNSNEGYDHTLTKIKIGHIFYIEFTKLGGVVLAIEGQKALNKKRKKKK